MVMDHAAEACFVVLKEIENHHLKGLKGADAAERLWNIVQKSLPLDSAEQVDEDRLSHHVLRLAFCRPADRGWFVAQVPDGEIVASCGIVVTHGRGRFQAVDTAEAHRRRGIASRIVHDVGRVAFDRFGAEQLVIVADAEYHAFERERCLAVCWWPGAPNAQAHPVFTAAD